MPTGCNVPYPAEPTGMRPPRGFRSVGDSGMFFGRKSVPNSHLASALFDYHSAVLFPSLSLEDIDLKILHLSLLYPAKCKSQPPIKNFFRQRICTGLPPALSERGKLCRRVLTLSEMRAEHSHQRALQGSVPFPPENSNHNSRRRLKMQTALYTLFIVNAYGIKPFANGFMFSRRISSRKPA